MKKVVFLGDTLVNNEPLGIQRFAYEILRELDRMEKVYRCEVLIPSNVDCKLTFESIDIVCYGDRTGFFWRQIDFPRYVQRESAIGIDLTLGLSIRGSDIVCLHDCIYETYPADFPTTKDKLKRISYLLRARIAVKRAKKIITVSHHSKMELMRLYHLPESRICVIGNAWQHMDRVAADHSVLTDLGLKSKAYCFALGSSLPHKNFKWIVAAAFQNPHMQFVVTGTNRLSKYSDEMNTADIHNIVFTGFLPDGQIKALMEHCHLFIQPSLVEGFGIPPMEAMCCGADILISNRTSLPEIYADTAHYFDPECYDSIQIGHMTAGKTAPRETVLEKYSWRSSAEELHKLIIEL